MLIDREGVINAFCII